MLNEQIIGFELRRPGLRGCTCTPETCTPKTLHLSQFTQNVQLKNAKF